MVVLLIVVDLVGGSGYCGSVKVPRSWSDVVGWNWIPDGITDGWNCISRNGKQLTATFCSHARHSQALVNLPGLSITIMMLIDVCCTLQAMFFVFRDLLAVQKTQVTDLRTTSKAINRIMQIATQVA